MVPEISERTSQSPTRALTVTGETGPVAPAFGVEVTSVPSIVYVPSGASTESTRSPSSFTSLTSLGVAEPVSLVATSVVTGVPSTVEKVSSTAW